MKKQNLYVDVHLLQTVPPSCVNRDDTGSPKTAVFGGVTRARVASQAWKHTMRVDFRDIFSPEQVGMRTKRVPALLADEIRRQSPGTDPKNADKLALKALENAGIGTKQEKKDPEATTKALFFISKAQLAALAALVLTDEPSKDAYKKALKETPAVDMALFGRMVADDPSLNFDAAAQVAHAISTHAVQNEYDYFTAVDDCSPEDNAGAGHLGTVEFNSSTLYRYATVNVRELEQHLGTDDTAAAVRNFAEAFIYTMPTGKQNTFANRTVPDFVYITLRTDAPANLCNAFEEPVKAGKTGYMQPSKQALVGYAKTLYRTFLDAPAAAYAMGEADGLDQLATVLPKKELLHQLEADVKARLAEVQV